MIDINKEYKTRDGDRVRIYSLDGGGTHTIHGAVFKDVEWTGCAWTMIGEVNPGFFDGLDLIEVKPRIKRTLWINIQRENGMSCSTVHDTREEADLYSSIGRIACLEFDLEFEEGEGL